ncbi:MAG: hypothetical protein AB8D52_02920 [Gammaproteobacteria bacterium]
MDYLLAQILLYLILAALIGFFIGWIIRGSGFESRMLTSENQWRSRHHTLQSENNRLQAELDGLNQAGKVTQEINPQIEADSSLPFRSRQVSSPSDTIETAQSHPLQSLRDELSQIEKVQSSNADHHVVETVSIDVEAQPLNSRPEMVEGSDDSDDLKRIKGIGPKIEATLNELGIYQFRQIANFTEDNINWVNEHLRFKGRIERENWISQANDLINNPTT